MNSPTDIYTRHIAEFSALLRQEGLAVGLQETADACTVLNALDLTDRNTVRDALCAVYAKSHGEQQIFYRLFDAYFVSEEARQAMLRRQREEAEEQAEQEENG